MYENERGATMNTFIGVERLRLKFAGEQSLLFQDVSLTIAKGEKLLLLGPSGCGKSTLLQVLSGIIPHSIEVPIKYDHISIPSSWGYVFQDPDTQFCMPYVDEELAFVLENLQLPREEMPCRIQQLLDRVGLQLPDVHTAIQKLSQGMKQRLAIATVLALEPDVLFLDEPTALLDPEGTSMVWETIQEVCGDKTIIIVEHKIDEVIDFVDRVVLFDEDGHIVTSGSKEHIFQHYRKQLVDYGIWYPNVWDDYVSSPAFLTLQQMRSEQRKVDDLARESVANESMIQLSDFRGFRGKTETIKVEHAEISSGEWITVIGSNGAGKSTLLLALMQLIRTQGMYALKGKSISANVNLSREIAFVFQNPEYQFVTNSVWDEVAYSLRLRELPEPDITVKVNELLQQFDLVDRQNAHPYQLSLGQKRRLSVAAAIAPEQPILLLDEPTFGQDAKNTFAMLEKLEYWRRQGTTIIMVTHDLEIVRYFATQVWEIQQGRLTTVSVSSANEGVLSCN